MRRRDRNVCGGITALTVIAPVRPEELNVLAGHLDGLPQGDGSPLARVRGTHFARWVIVDDVVYQGRRQRRRDRLSAPRLLFTSNFDGSRDAYLEEMRRGFGADADAIWGHCPGYPGRADPAAWADWFRAHAVDSSLFFAAYGEQRVGEVHAGLALRDRVIAFALEAQGLAPAALRARFREAFGQ